MSKEFVEGIEEMKKEFQKMSQGNLNELNFNEFKQFFGIIAKGSFFSRTQPHQISASNMNGIVNSLLMRFALPTYLTKTLEVWDYPF